MGAKSTQEDKMNFEAALTALEEVVNEIESNPLELEELVLRYERGMKLLKHCRAILEDTKKRLIVLNRDGDTDSPDNSISTTDKTDDVSEFRLS